MSIMLAVEEKVAQSMLEQEHVHRKVDIQILADTLDVFFRVWNEVLVGEGVTLWVVFMHVVQASVGYHEAI